MQAVAPKKLKKAIVSQHDSNDCGAACILSILRFYGVSESLERLKSISGTTKNGTTMLGLQEALATCNILANGYEADILDLAKIEKPAILHVTIDKHFNHYIVCYGINKNGFLIVDPMKGFSVLSEVELGDIWSGRLLLIEDAGGIVSKEDEGKFIWFFNLLRNHIDKFFSALFIGFLITILTLSTALFTESIVDKYLLKGLYIEGIQLALVWAMLLFVNEILVHIRTIIINKQVFGFNLSLFNQYFSKLFAMPLIFFEGKETGDLISRMNDGESIVDTTTSIISQALIDITIILIILIYLLSVNLQLGFIVSGGVFVYLGIAYLNTPKLKMLQRNLIISHAKRESFFIDVFSNIEILKSYNVETKYGDKLSKKYKEYEDDRLSLNTHVNIYSSLINASQHFIALSCFLWVALGISNNELEIGVLFSTFILVLRFNSSMRSLLILNVNLQASLISLNRLHDFSEIKVKPLDLIPNEQLTASNDIQLIRTEAVTLRYIGYEEVIKNASFEAKRGQITCLVGVNGAGKSSFLKLLKRAIEPSSGTIYLNSIESSRYRIQDWNKLVGYIEQNPKVLSGTVFENVSLGTEFTAQEVEVLIEKYQFLEFINSFPDGINTHIGIGGFPISGGQKQIISILRGLIYGYNVLLLDEPTSSVDSYHKRLITDILFKLKGELIIVVTSHDKDFLAIADKIYTFNDNYLSLS